MATEPLIRNARWTAPLILAPCAAAVFAASVSWAAGTMPASTAQPASAAGRAASNQAGSNQATSNQATSNSATGGRHRASAAARRALHRELKQRSRQAAQLQQRLQALRGGSGSVHITVPQIPAAPAPAPVPAPPPVNTVTGASG